MSNNPISVSDDCIYLTNHSGEVKLWIDYGTRGELRNVYIYKNDVLKLKGTFIFYRRNLLITRGEETVPITWPITWPCEKNDDSNVIVIDGDSYKIDTSNEHQVSLFKELMEHVFG